MKKFRYRVRPGYGSKALLVEIIPDTADDDFMTALRIALKELNLKVTNVADLWMNDEVLLSFESDLGAFDLSKDIWNLVFILAPENQPLIKKVDELLTMSGQFQKEMGD